MFVPNRQYHKFNSMINYLILYSKLVLEFYTALIQINIYEDSNNLMTFLQSLEFLNTLLAARDDLWKIIKNYVRKFGNKTKKTCYSAGQFN